MTIRSARNMKQWVCHCAAYAFPHRRFGGQCVAGTFDDPECTCTAPPVSCVDESPPEVRACSWCSKTLPC